MHHLNFLHLQLLGLSCFSSLSFTLTRRQPFGLVENTWYGCGFTNIINFFLPFFHRFMLMCSAKPFGILPDACWHNSYSICPEFVSKLWLFFLWRFCTRKLHIFLKVLWVSACWVAASHMGMVLVYLWPCLLILWAQIEIGEWLHSINSIYEQLLPPSSHHPHHDSFCPGYPVHCSYYFYCKVFKMLFYLFKFFWRDESKYLYMYKLHKITSIWAF